MLNFLAKLKLRFGERQKNLTPSEQLRQLRIDIDGSDDAVVQLKFNHCQFLTSDIEKLTLESVKKPGEVGSVNVFQVSLEDGRYFQISPYDVIYLSSADEDIYYRE